jgi:hypothetical protein
MDRLQRTPITLETRQAVFQAVERNPRTEQIVLNTFAMLRLVTMLSLGLGAAASVSGNISRGLVDWGAWRYVLATIGAVAAGLVGLSVGFLPFHLYDRIRSKRRIRRIKEASEEELWRMVDYSVWYVRSTVALIQLAARGKDVSRVLPRLIQMLDSSEYTTRRQAFGALRLVFFDEARAIGDYNPESSHGDCRDKVARLKELLG